MALKLGSLYVELTARTSGLEKGIANAAKTVEKFGNDLKKVGAAAQQMAVIVNGAIAASLVVASKLSDKVSDQTTKLKDTMNSFAVELATAVLPAVKALTDKLQEILAWYQQLSPAQKEQIAHWIQFTATALAAVAVLGKVGGAISAVATVVKMLLPLFAGFAPFLAVLAGFGLVAVAIVTALGFVELAMEGAFGFKIQKTITETMAIISSYAEMMQAVASGDFSGARKAFTAARAVQRIAENRRSKEGSGLQELDVAGAMRKALEKGASMIGDAIKNALPAWMTGKGNSGPPKVYSEKSKHGGKREMPFGGPAISTKIGDINKSMEASAELLQEEYEASERRWNAERDYQNTVTEYVVKAEDELQKAFDTAFRVMGTFADRIISKAGKAGEIAQNAMGAAKDGGWWAAIISVILDLVMDMKAFARIVESATRGIRLVIAALDKIVQVFGSDAEQFDFLGTLVELSFNSIINVVKFFVNSVLLTARSVAVAVNWINQAWLDIVAFFTGKERKWVDAIDLSGIDGMLTRLNDVTFDRINAEDMAREGAEKFGATMNSISQSLTNVPATFKLAAAQFGAQDGGGGFGSLAPAGGAISGGRSGQSGTINHYHFEGPVYGYDDFAEEVVAALNKRTHQRTGLRGTRG